MPKTVFISCGELSGEIHASNLIKEIKLQNTDYHIKAFGSKLIKEQGIELVEDYKDYSFSGFSEILPNLGKILKLKSDLAKQILEFNPDLVLLVDYGGFHTQLAKELKAKKYQGKIIQFIAPQIWASRPWRINNIKRYFDKVFCTLPFEEEIYLKNKIPVSYVGNPVFASLTERKTKADLKISEDEILFGVFPGSRKPEIQYMLPIMLESAQILKAKYPQQNFRFLLAKAPNLDIEILNKYGFNKQNDIELLKTDYANPNHALLSAADCLWLCSGTVTLEAAFYGTPYFLSYRSSLLNYSLYLILRTIKKAGLANIISGKNLVKEFLQYDANVKNFVGESSNWLTQKGFSDYFNLQKQALNEFSQSFATFPSYKIVASEIAKELKASEFYEPETRIC